MSSQGRRKHSACLFRVRENCPFRRLRRNMCNGKKTDDNLIYQLLFNSCKQLKPTTIIIKNVLLKSCFWRDKVMVWYARYLSQYKSAFTLDDGFDTFAFNLVVLFCFVLLNCLRVIYLFIVPAAYRKLEIKLCNTLVLSTTLNRLQEHASAHCRPMANVWNPASGRTLRVRLQQSRRRRDLLETPTVCFTPARALRSAWM